MKVSLVPLEQINNIWDSICPFLEPAVEVTNGRYTTYDVYVLLQTSKMCLWVAFDDDGVINGIQVTAITDYPSKRALTSVFTGGINLRSWREPMMVMLQNWAKDNGCQIIEGYGREGWVKMLQPYGVRMTQVAFEKEV